MKDLYKGFIKVAEDDMHAKLKHQNGHELTIAKQHLSKNHLKQLKSLPLHQAEPESEIGATPIPTEQPIPVDYSSPEFKQLSQAWGGGQNIPQNVIDDLVKRGAPGFGSSSVAAAKEQVPQPSSMVEEKQIPGAPKLELPEPGSFVPKEEVATQIPQQAAREPMQQIAPTLKEPSKPKTPEEVLADPNVSSSQKLMAANQLFLNSQKKQQEADDEFQREMSKTPQQIPKMLSGQGFLGGLARILGFVMGGGAQGVLGLNENPAVSMFNSQVNREIEAQRYEADKKMNLYKLHQNRLQNDSQAALQLGINLRQIADQQFNELMGKTGLGPMALQNLQTLKAQNELAMQQSKMALANMKFQQQMMQQTQAGIGTGQKMTIDPAMLVPSRVPEHHQENVYKEIERAQDTRRMSNAILKAFDDAAKEQTVLKTGAGYLRTSPSLKLLHQALQPTFKDLEGTVRQAAMDNTFSNVSPAAGDFESTIAKKRAGLIDYLQSKASAPRAKSFGIDLDKFESTSPQKQAAEIKTMNGIKYQKVPGGWVKVQ